MTPNAPSVRRRVLVLGGAGQLGRACVDSLRRDVTFDVDCTDRRSAQTAWRIDVVDDAERLWSLLARERYDLIINAIGVLRDAIRPDDDRSMRGAIEVNALFPHELAERATTAGSRVVHVSTDAVFAGSGTAPYDESASPAPRDAYGAMKWVGEPRSPMALTVRCSIVGRRKDGPHSLIDWFLALPPGSAAHGYVDYLWTATTAPQVARLMGRLADPAVFDRLRSLSPVFHFAPNPPISKWDMIDMLNQLRGQDVRVERANHPGGAVDLRLTTRFDAFRELSLDPRPWPAALSEACE